MKNCDVKEEEKKDIDESETVNTIEPSWDLSPNESELNDSRPSLDVEPVRSVIPETKPKSAKKVV